MECVRELLAWHVSVKTDLSSGVLLQVSRRRLVLRLEIGHDSGRRSMCVREWPIGRQYGYQLLVSNGNLFDRESGMSKSNVVNE